MNDIKELHKDIMKHKCDEQVTSAFLGLGNYNADVMFVCERPGYHTTDPAHGITLKGNKSGDFFFECLVECKKSINDVYITNVVKLQKKYNETPTKEEIDFWKPFLLREINIVKPQLIVLMGKVALNTFFEDKFVMQNICETLELDGNRFYILPHPAWALRSSKEDNYKRYFKGIFENELNS